jgi:hypothetical protein
VVAANEYFFDFGVAQATQVVDEFGKLRLFFQSNVGTNHGSFASKIVNPGRKNFSEIARPRALCFRSETVKKTEKVPPSRLFGGLCRVLAVL